VLAVVDTGALHAAADADHDDHERCLEALARPACCLVIPALVVAVRPRHRPALRLLP
jgi:hypothetical protein